MTASLLFLDGVGASFFAAQATLTGDSYDHLLQL